MAAPATVAGAISLPEPTLQHISIVWAISGDDDFDGVVSVRYRVNGSGTWSTGMALRRVPTGSNGSFSWGEAHRGSLFGLQPNTQYDIELSLNDPDGGSTQQIVSATTRAVPSAGSGSVRAATPGTLSNVLALAVPGDIVELGAGSYSGFTISKSGIAGAPITLRGSAGAVITGELAMFFQSHLRLENLTINGRIRFNGSDDISIVGCTITARTQNAGDGIVSFLRSARAYIANNTITGTTVWQESAFGSSGNNLGEGIAVTGPGHVIENNTVSRFRDAISFLEDSEAVDQYSLDVLNNTISQAADDGIEADFCFHNCRILGNRITNSFIAMSAQPSLGGPTYFIRNQAYSVAHLPFKLYRTSRGDVILHNTVVKHGDGFNAYPGTPIGQALVLNNLFLGGPAGSFNGFSSGSGRVVDLQTLETGNSRLDYNGYGTTLTAFNGRIGAQSFSSVTQMQSSTSEINGLRVGYDVFASNIAFPSAPASIYTPVDLSLAEGSAAVDRGVVIPGLNEDFNDAAPDLGAIERPSSGGVGQVFRNGFE
ncbi:right-handed parallel beta-helix repeat-containing protein [Pseudoxanthomonas sp. CAU 1598]|uniref:Right-handed parallel beta-helix repeat-containing protein n=1 Tax=Pseudomarimonas arenosa TaxID=2774145 RepID=A0AAW3ZM60_9GAMM|nr:right-handed parallel beta-helix repeat-containing protein [Pseudomarimonas arenosa]